MCPSCVRASFAISCNPSSTFISGPISMFDDSMCSMDNSESPLEAFFDICLGEEEGIGGRGDYGQIL